MFRSSKNINKSWTQNSTLNLALLEEHLISSLFAMEPIYKAGQIIVMRVAGWATGLALIYKDPYSFLPRAAQKPGKQVKECERESDAGLITKIMSSAFTPMFLSENNKAVINIFLI